MMVARRWAVAIVAAALVGCGPPKMQPGPGRTQQDFEQDSYTCQQRVKFWLFDADLYRSCMRGLGQVD